MVPARTRPITWPLRMKYWKAFMVGEPLERNPSTSSGPRPPIHTVAPKSSSSRPGRVFVARMWLVPMPHEGSGVRSGSTSRGGFVSVWALGSRDAQQPPVRAGDRRGDMVGAKAQPVRLIAELKRVHSPALLDPPRRGELERV